MKRMCLTALTGALAISTMVVAVDVASAATRGGVYRGGVHRVGMGRGGIAHGRAAVVYRGGWHGYHRLGLGVAAGAAFGTTAAQAYYGDDSGYAAYASADYGASGAHIWNGAYISESDAVAYCAQRFRSYDVESRTFLAYGGQPESCGQAHEQAYTKCQTEISANVSGRSEYVSSADRYVVTAGCMKKYGFQL